MVTKREKQLAILLLKERLEHQTGKKVVLKENTAPLLDSQVKEFDTDLKIQAQKFCTEFLKLGSKQNLFDAWMINHNINPQELNNFMKEVIKYIQTNYLYNGGDIEA